MVAGLHHYDIVSSPIHGIIYWFIISLFLVIFLRSFVLQFMPSEQYYRPVDEDDNAVGDVAEVVEGN